jgi:ribonucleoside-diphosphate reductase alpha chain
MANVSAVYEEKPNAIEFMEEWLALARSGSGERGIFNRAALLKHLPSRRKRQRFYLNPCGEIWLRSCGLCNLSITVARPDDDVHSLTRKVRLAAIFGTLQATLTDFKYLRPIWKADATEERLLGVDITGQMDCPLLRPDNQDRGELLSELKKVVLAANEEWARKLGINVSVATTCVKPSGNSAVLLGCSSGLHPRWSTYQIRRVRVGRYDPVANLLVAEGVPHAVDPLNDSLLVFDFPVAAPAGCVTRDDLTAIQQLENWLVWRKHWTEHNPSATVYVGPDEWLAVGHWVYEHFDDVCGITFLPRDSGSHRLAPNEEVTKERYDELVARFPVINWSKLSRYEHEDQTTSSSEVACAGGACEL